MGSGSSTSVTPVKENNSHGSSQISQHEISKEDEFRRNADEPGSTTSPVFQVAGSTEEQAAVNELEKQIGQLESEKLDLQEQVTALEEKLEEFTEKQKTTDSQEINEFQNTVQAKDKHIEQLVSENEAIKLQLKKLRKHYKKRLRLVNVQMEETKHKMSIEMIELKEEITKLREQSDASKDTYQETDGLPDDTQRGKTSIILALSTQVAEQEAVIADLRKSLAASGHADALDNDVEPNSRDLDDSGFSTKFTQNSYKSKADSNITDEPSLDELNSIVNEMKQYKKEKATKKRNQHTKSEGMCERNSSGVSRDSGIMASETILSDEDKSGDKRSHHTRVTSATSRSSALSDFSLDDDDDIDSCTERTDSRTSTDPASIRRISAYKNRKKPHHEPAQLEKLLNNATHKSVSFNVPSKMDV